MQHYLDQAAAYAAKQLDGSGFLNWLLPGILTQRRLSHWLDTRAIALPGEPDRRCDTVAGLEHATGQVSPEALVIEFKDRARGMPALEQLAEYALRIHREVPVQADLADRFAVGSVLVNLTGVQAVKVLVLQASALRNAQLKFKPVIRDLETRSGCAALRGIAAGRLSRCVLAWIPLLRGGQESAIIQRWKRLAETEADERKRSDYAALALVFAEAADREEVWRRALEGWNVKPSPIVEAWRQEGRQEGRAEGLAVLRAKLLHCLRRQLGSDLPAELRAQIENQTDLAVLDRWFDLALEAASLEQFRAALPPTANGQ
ncbi:MAG TPA: hypothetical protein VMG10_10825 [Gemmataceae bacterium]|nr:hypothetical protein [Gemmataceae bacterium]